MADHIDLEIGLYRHEADTYAVELRFRQPQDQSDPSPERGMASFDLMALREQLLDADAYGRQLTRDLFADPLVRGTFAKARAAAEVLATALRVRLFVDRSAPELHNLRWETLRDPEHDARLLLDEQILFSRYQRSTEWRPVKLRPKGALRALVVIANPAGLADPKHPYLVDGRPLAPIDVPMEWQRAQEALGSIATTPLLSDSSTATRVTLDALAGTVAQGYDILYLVCHGALFRKDPQSKLEPYLWLEQDNGAVAVVPGIDLVERIRVLRERPRLVVLASCQSAGTGTDAHSADEGALAALGPRLAQAGVPAVLAVQGNVTFKTVAAFMPVFFQVLRENGVLDLAIAKARSMVADQPDWWMPVLFSRLRDGAIWYVPGFGEAFEQWPLVLNRLGKGKCTPILGLGLVESLFGDTRDVARRWAETYGFPMEPSASDDLPQVAQFLAVNQDPLFPRENLMTYLREELLSRYQSIIPPELRDASLERLIEAVGAERRKLDPVEPHCVLARLPFPIYLTANPDNLLEAALIAAGRTPEVVLCPWNDTVEQISSIYDTDPDWTPTAEHPLVYHLFGHLDQPDSIVLTEDDYFNYLAGVTSNKELIPEKVRRQLADSTLLFLGFHMEDWNFRVLFRSLMGQEGSRRRDRYAHVAVQIQPDEGRILQPERARAYLSAYFRTSKINIYWGGAEDFIRELAPQIP